MTTNDKLHILWTNDNITTAEKMVFMYAINAKSKGWWDEVSLIIWGAPVQLAAENKLIQELIEEARLEGVHVSCCKACSDQLGVTEELEKQGIEPIYQGLPLTRLLKEGERLLTI